MLTGSQLVKTFRFLWSPKVHYRMYKSPPPVPHLEPYESSPCPTSHFLKTHRNIIPPATQRNPYTCGNLKAACNSQPNRSGKCRVADRQGSGGGTGLRSGWAECGSRLRFRNGKTDYRWSIVLGHCAWVGAVCDVTVIHRSRAFVERLAPEDGTYGVPKRW